MVISQEARTAEGVLLKPAMLRQIHGINPLQLK